MNRILPVLLASLFYLFAHSQSGSWVWMKGSLQPKPLPVYGTMGVPNMNNTPQGLYEAANWIDFEGNFWIFGGVDSNHSTTNDLWKYEPANNIWTWMKGSGGGENVPGVYGTLGVPSPLNNPGARGWGSLTWTDNNGDLWLFGGGGTAQDGSYAASLNDLWRYNVATNEWTWMQGFDSINHSTPVYGTLQQPALTNTPGGRAECNSTWVDNNNNLWLFGGQELIGGDGNDMWMYNMSVQQWAWMSGPAGVDHAGNYGTRGIASPLNLPPPRFTYTHWKDIEGNFYIFAGFNSTLNVMYSDVWKYSPVSNQWVWVAGDSIINSTGNYQQACVNNGFTGPMARFENRSAQFLGCTNVFMSFGGIAWEGDLNDLWAFNSQTNGWTLISPPTTGLPQGRYGNCTWEDNSGRVWILGGMFGNPGTLLNDLWKFIPDSTCTPVISGAANLNYTLTRTMACPGDSTYLTISGVSNATVTPPVNLVATDSTHYYAYITINQTTTYTISGQSPCGPATQIFTLTPLTRGFGITTDKTSLCNGDSARICAADNLSTYQWNTGDTTACIYAHDSGQYVVIVSQAGNCTVTSNTINITDNPPADDSITVHGDTLMAFGDVSYQWLYNNSPISGATSDTYIASANGNYSLQVTNSAGCSAEASKQVALTGIAEEQIENSILVFPNPTTNGWQLDVNPALLGSTVEVFDVTGRLVFKSILENQQLFVSFTAARGVYQLRINLQGYSFVRKLIKL